MPSRVRPARFFVANIGARAVSMSVQGMRVVKTARGWRIKHGVQVSVEKVRCAHSRENQNLPETDAITIDSGSFGLSMKQSNTRIDAGSRHSAGATNIPHSLLWSVCLNSPCGRFSSEPAVPVTAVRCERISPFGREGEVANGCFGAFQFVESGFG